MLPGDALLTILAYAMTALMIVVIPVAIIVAFIKHPVESIMKAYADYQYRVVDNAMRATEKITLPDGSIILKTFENGVIDYKPAFTVTKNTTEQVDLSSDAAMFAARWIVASYATTQCKNDKHKHGPNGRQLLTQDECLDPDIAVFGSPREWDSARKWLSDQLLVVEQVNTSLPGTHADRPLYELIKVLTTLPQRKK